MTSALEGMASAVHGAFDLDPIERSIERMRELGLLTDVVANAYRALADAAHTPWREMQGLAEKFGIAQGGLGTGFAQSRVSGLGSELAEAFKTLMDAGGDPFQIAIGLMRTAQDEHGKPSEGGLEQVIRDALETGSLVPEELKPVLAALQNAGVLVDEISRLKFGDPGEDARNALHDLLSEINEQVHEAALENADLVIEGIQAASDAQIEKTQWLADTLVEAIERGHFDLDALTQWLGPDTRWTGPTKDGSPNDLFKILDGAQISLSGPILGADGQPIDFSFNMEGFKSELSGLLAALQPDPSKWQPIIDSIHAAFGAVAGVGRPALRPVPQRHRHAAVPGLPRVARAARGPDGLGLADVAGGLHRLELGGTAAVAPGLGLARSARGLLRLGLARSARGLLGLGLAVGARGLDRMGLAEAA